jgi:hypothetical protein
MRSLVPFLLLLLLTQQSAGQQPDSVRLGFVFLPGRLQCIPLAANEQEPRVGVRKEFGSSRMKLDIGSSIDLLGWETPGGAIRAGAEFFTYALTTSARGLRLQVDAVDGFFGGHVTCAFPGPEQRAWLRLRVLHESGHLIDGHWDFSAGAWRDGKVPVPYTRDFAELTGALAWNGEQFSWTLYSGASYAWLARPDDIKHWATLHGVEVRTNGWPGAFLAQPAEGYAAAHVTFTGVPAYYATVNAEAGVKLGAWEEKGIRLYLNYRNGLELFSQYYASRREFWGAGFSFDFW